MLNVTKELTALARKLGYTGKAPDTVAKAINAITASVGEGGGEGGGGCDCEPLVVPVEEPDDPQTAGYYYRTTKTAKEIFDALDAGKQVWIAFSASKELIGRYGMEGDKYMIVFMSDSFVSVNESDFMMPADSPIFEQPQAE